MVLGSPPLCPDWGCRQAKEKPPRPRWPRGSPCAGPEARVTRRKVSRLTLSVKFVDGRRQLPVVEVKIAA